MICTTVDITEVPPVSADVRVSLRRIGVSVMSHWLAVPQN